MPCTATQFLTVLAGEIGTSESPHGSNRTKYGKWFGADGSAWCDMFVSWCGWKCQSTGIIGKFAYTPSHAHFFKARGQWHTGAKGIRRGDIVFFDFPNDGVDRISHIGVVEGVRSNGDIVTIEGNTSVGDNRNGGMVMRRVRNGNYVEGYGRPNYVPETLPKRSPYTLRGFLREGAKGPAVKRLQTALRIKVDGVFGNATENAVKSYQRRKGIFADGVVGKDTARALGWIWRSK